MNEIIDQALRILQEKSLDGYEIYFDESSHFDIESKNGKIETLQTSEYLGMAFRILNHQRMGFSYTTFSKPSPSAGQDFSNKLDRMIGDAMEVPSNLFRPQFRSLPVLRSSSAAPIFDETLEKSQKRRR
jgi:hypothetical protein